MPASADIAAPSLRRQFPGLRDLVQLTAEPGRPGIEFFGRSGPADRARIHDGNMLGERQRFFLIMSDEDHRPAERLLYLLELASDAHLQFHFQIRKRLIEQENIRVNHPRRNLSNTRRNHYCAESDSCWTKYPMVERRNAIGRARIKGKAKKVLKRNGQTDERVHHAIYAAIISHQISPGTALQEDALA